MTSRSAPPKDPDRTIELSVRRLPSIDDPVDLADLLPQSELDELVSGFADVHGGGCAILDATGAVRAAAGLGISVIAALPEVVARPEGVDVAGARAWAADIRHGAEILGAIVSTAPGGRKVVGHGAEIIGLILHHAHARQLMSAAHEAAIEHAFAEVNARNRRLEVAVERLQEVDRLKSNFLATMSHELRTPLTSVIGYAEMLVEGLAGPLNDEQRDYVATILGKADQLLQLITSILDVSLLESGRTSHDHAPVALGEIADSVIASFQPQAGKRDIVLEVTGQKALRVLGDRRKIRQVVWSLVSNAVKFTPDRGRVTVELRAGPLAPRGLVDDGDDNRWGAQVVVRDSGIGISRDKLAHIFEPFFQVDSSSTREYGGSGLGLTLAKAYVEAHGGRIWVDSTPRQGSTFTVSFPAVDEDVDAARAAGLVGHPGAGTPDGGNPG